MEQLYGKEMKITRAPNPGPYGPCPALPAYPFWGLFLYDSLQAVPEPSRYGITSGKHLIVCGRTIQPTDYVGFATFDVVLRNYDSDPHSISKLYLLKI